MQATDLPDLEYRMRRKDGSWVWLLSRERVFTREPDGKPLQILGVATDITARKHFEEQLLASEERFRGIFENAPTGISISDIDGNFVQCNPAYEKILGYGLEELRNASFTMLVHPDDRAANLAQMERLVRQEIPYFEIFNRSIHKSGRIVWVHKFVLMLKDREGRPVNIVALVTDMTERKRQEEQIRLLMREVNHRSKNLLAVVQSVARQTAIHGDPQSFAQRFSERLQGLAASHDLLVHNSWQGVGLEELVHSQLSHFKDLVGGRISLSGPALRINAAAAQSLGMALARTLRECREIWRAFEPHGQVSITWVVEDAPGGQALHLAWRESGGPAVDGARSFRARQPHPDAARRTVAGCRGEARLRAGRAVLDAHRAARQRGGDWPVRSALNFQAVKPAEASHSGKQAQPAGRNAPEHGLQRHAATRQAADPRPESRDGEQDREEACRRPAEMAWEGSSTRPMISPFGLQSVVMKSLSAPFCAGPIASPRGSRQSLTAR